MGKLKEVFAHYKEVARQKSVNAPYPIQFYNFWEQRVTDMWFYRFVQSRHLLEGKNKRICFYSTFGDRTLLRKTKGDLNIFFTGENVNRKEHQRYADHFLNEDSIHLALGFEDIDHPNYLRFPLWLLYMFEPEASDAAIVKRCAALNHPQVGQHRKFACHISSYDETGLRGQMCEALSAIEMVDCAGKVRHNCDDLWKVYGDDKMKFISEYKFNICPENSSNKGYVTEKLFQAVDAGCIPVYWGGLNDPEPEVLNPEAIVFWNPEGENADALGLIRQLNGNDALYEAFTRQNRLKEGAADYVMDRFHELENRISVLL